MGRVVTFGELMLKLSPPAYERLIQAHSLNVEYSGAEANVAVSLSSFGVLTSFVSAVPNNVMGKHLSTHCAVLALMSPMLFAKTSA